MCALLAAKYWPNDGVTLRADARDETLAQPDRGRSQRAECGDINRLAIHHPGFEDLACTVVAARRRTSPSLISEQ